MSVGSLILGRPLASHEQNETQIGPGAGVPAMGLDGVTSAAYGPEAALTILLPLGVFGLRFVGPIMLVILFLLAVLYVSYRQTIAAYPVNGGSYTVAKENLGRWPGLLAAAALLIDYVLNVAVGISAGIAALVSAAPPLHRFTVPLCIGVLVIITLLNLRGTAEAGMAFSIPTYTFIGCMALVLGVGTVKALLHGGHPQPMVPPPAVPAATEAVGLWLLLRAFASGCTAMTGVEAVSNGVSVFREPRVKNAHRTLSIIVGVLALLLGGVAYLTHAYGVMAMPQNESGYQSVLSQLTAAVFGRGWFYYLAIGSVLSTLCLSANTSFVDFPRLCRLIAKDDFLPRGFAIVGRRLVYSFGIIFLAVAAGTLLVGFRGITDRLIPLFAVGAFLAFTLSQAGMVAHWWKQPGTPKPEDAKSEGEPLSGKSRSVRLAINGVGAVCTAIALVIILAAKFVEGAWITVIAVPVLLVCFRAVHGHYERVAKQIAAPHPLNLTNNQPPVVLVPTRGWNRLTENALRFAMWLSAEVTAVHLSNLSGEEADEEQEQLRRDWAKDVEQPARDHGVAAPKLAMVPCPYRRFAATLLGEIDRIKTEHPGRLIAVVIPEVMENRWWLRLLHRRKPAKLRAALLKRGDNQVVVVNVPWYLGD